MLVLPSLSDWTDICACAAAGILTWTFRLAWRCDTVGWATFLVWSAGLLTELLNVVLSVGASPNKGPDVVEIICSVLGVQMVCAGWVALAIFLASCIWTVREALKPATAPVHSLPVWAAASFAVPTAPFVIKPIAKFLGLA